MIFRTSSYIARWLFTQIAHNSCEKVWAVEQLADYPCILYSNRSEKLWITLINEFYIYRIEQCNIWARMWCRLIYENVGCNNYLDVIFDSWCVLSSVWVNYANIRPINVTIIYTRPAQRTIGYYELCIYFMITKLLFLVHDLRALLLLLFITITKEFTDSLLHIHVYAFIICSSVFLLPLFYSALFSVCVCVQHKSMRLW